MTNPSCVVGASGGRVLIRRARPFAAGASSNATSPLPRRGEGLLSDFEEASRRDGFSKRVDHLPLLSWREGQEVCRGRDRISYLADILVAVAAILDCDRGPCQGLDGIIPHVNVEDMLLDSSTA